MTLMAFKVPEKQTFKIGEVCEMLQLEPYVLRYWESEFEDLSPQKNAMGQRIYRPRDIEIIYLIKKLLYEEGYTILGARKQLKREIAKLNGSEGMDREEVVQNLRKIRWQLQEILTLLGKNGK
jgi:DNA-binding transcriptional MerR regulator